jgi:hypothetical protein
MAKQVITKRKAAPPAPPPRSNVPATPVDLDAFVREDVGKGISTKAEDNLVPLLYILQPLSPQVNKKDSAYMDGAEQGMFWLRNVNDPLVAGDEGIYFQPCEMYQEWVEWVPRTKGGGFVRRHSWHGGQPPTGAKQKPHEAGDRRPPSYTLNGNELINTRYVPGIVWRNGHADAFVIPFKSTGHATARGWMTKQTGMQSEKGILASFSHVYHLTTRQTQNALGTWYKIDVGEPIPLVTLKNGTYVENPEAEDIVGDASRAYMMGRALNAAFATGEKTAEGEMQTEENGDTL